MEDLLKIKERLAEIDAGHNGNGHSGKHRVVNGIEYVMLTPQDGKVVHEGREWHCHPWLTHDPAELNGKELRFRVFKGYLMLVDEEAFREREHRGKVAKYEPFMFWNLVPLEVGCDD